MKLVAMKGLSMIVIKLIGGILAIISILSLAQDVFTFGFTYALSTLLEYYDGLSQLFLGWMTPIIVALGRIIFEFVNLDFQVGDHWRHVFVLSSLYFARDSTTFLVDDDKIGFAGTLILGLFVAALISVAISSIPLNSSDTRENLVASLFPLWGFAIYRSIRSVWATLMFCEEESMLYDFQRRVYYSLLDVVVGAFIITHSIIFFRLENIFGLPLISLGCAIALLSVWLIYKGYQRTGYPNILHRDERVKFLSHGNTIHGLEIVKVYLGVTFVIFADAGLKKFGL